MFLRIIVYGFLVNPDIPVPINTTSTFSRAKGDLPTGPTSISTNFALAPPSLNFPAELNQRSISRKTYAPHSAFLRNSFNRLDFVVIICYWIDFTLVSSNITTITVFASIATLRPIRLLALTKGLSTILESLRVSAPLLVDVLIFLLFFFMLFTIIGVIAFQGSLSRRCFLNDTKIIAYPPKACGSDFSFNSTRKGYTCPVGQSCGEAQAPFYNFVSFDNPLKAFLFLLTIVSMEDYTVVMYQLADAEYDVACLYFVFVIVLIAFVMINLFIAVITETFENVRQSRGRAFEDLTG